MSASHSSINASTAAIDLAIDALSATRDTIPSLSAADARSALGRLSRNLNHMAFSGVEAKARAISLIDEKISALRAVRSTFSY